MSVSSPQTLSQAAAGWVENRAQNADWEPALAPGGDLIPNGV